MRASHEHPADPALVGLIFGAALAGCGLRRCGWCSSWMGLAPELPVGEVTHGICPPCWASELAKADAVFAPLAVREVGGA